MSLFEVEKPEKNLSAKTIRSAIGSMNRIGVPSSRAGSREQSKEVSKPKYRVSNVTRNDDGLITSFEIEEK